MPMIAFIGVRISWLMLARNIDFARVADSATARASSSSRSTTCRCLMSSSIDAAILLNAEATTFNADRPRRRKTGLVFAHANAVSHGREFLNRLQNEAVDEIGCKQRECQENADRRSCKQHRLQQPIGRIANRKGSTSIGQSGKARHGQIQFRLQYLVFGSVDELERKIGVRLSVRHEFGFCRVVETLRRGEGDLLDPFEALADCKCLIEDRKLL